MRLFVLTVVAFALAGAPTLAQKPYAGTATGALTVDGKAIPLKYAYVVEVDNVEEVGQMSGEPEKYQVLVLTDRPLPLASVADRNAPFADRHSPGEIMEPLKKSVADKMYGIMLRIDPGKTAPLRTDFYYPSRNTLSFSVVGTEYPDRITGLKRAGGFLSGTALLATAQETHLDKGPKKYQYRVTFRAPILSEAPITAKLEGQAALDSPQVAALKAYLIAGKKGDVDTLRKLTAETHLEYLKSAEFLKSLKSGDLDKVAEQVKRVVARGDTATIFVVNTEPTYSQVSMRLVREKGVWKLCWP